MKVTSIRVGLLFLTCMLAAHAARAQEVGQTFIIGDTSGSMQGYAKGGPNQFAALYHLLYRNAAAPRLAALTSDAQTSVARVDPVAQASFFGAPGKYRGETDLVFALRYIQQKDGLSVFVTDGMQSQGTYLRVKEELLKMVRDGWGVWLLSVKLPFNGLYDPEQTIDLDALGPSINDCARHDDPRAVVTYKAGSNRFYNYAGLKPLLLFVLTKDTTVGRELTQRLDFNLKADPQYSSQVAELSPLFYRGLSFSAAEPVSDYVRLEEGTNEVVIHSDTIDEQRIKEVIVPVLWQAGEPPVPQPFKEWPTFSPPESVSWVEDEPQAVADESDPEGKRTPGRFKVRFVSELPWYRHWFCFLPFIDCEDVKAEPLNLQVWTEFREVEAPWWAALNADNSYQCPTRVYKLTELAHDVAQAAKERLKPEERKAIKSLRLVIGRV
ncbi:MAG: hypothetical protein WCF57_19735 [Pyrinomonadaceae bacterium]